MVPEGSFKRKRCAEDALEAWRPKANLVPLRRYAALLTVGRARPSVPLIDRAPVGLTQREESRTCRTRRRRFSFERSDM
jgi:hypothetical protein